MWDIGFSTDPAQTFLIINDGTNQQIWVLLRDTLAGRERVRAAPATGPGSSTARTISPSDSKGNLFISETYEGKRVQKFIYRGMGPATTPLKQLMP